MVIFMVLLPQMFAECCNPKEETAGVLKQQSVFSQRKITEGCVSLRMSLIKLEMAPGVDYFAIMSSQFPYSYFVIADASIMVFCRFCRHQIQISPLHIIPVSYPPF